MPLRRWYALSAALLSLCGANASEPTQGIELTARYKFEYWRNTSGGLGLGHETLGNVDLQAAIDGEKAFGWPGSSAFVYVLGNHGGRPNDLAGTNGGITNIEVATPAWKIYEAWVQQEVAGGKLSLRAGLHDLNTEFYSTKTSGLFLNPTYGIGTEMSGSGDNGPSIFPTTSLAARLLYKPFTQGYIEAGIFDGVPGDVNNPKGTHISLGGGDGSLLVFEGGVLGKREGRLAAGAWTYTARKPDFVTGLAARSHGVYFLYDRALVIDQSAEPKTLLSGFVRAGFTGGDVDPYEYSWSAGLVWRKADSDDELGLGFSESALSRKFAAVTGAPGRREYQVELTYRVPLTPRFIVQPDIQYTIHPGGDPSIRNSLVIGIRTEIAF